jgi:hypothetical protein
MKKIIRMKGKVLFLGCNKDQLPYLREIKKLGYYIIGTDINKNAPGIKLLNKYYQVSYEDHKELIKIGHKEKFTSKDKVFTAASQFAYLGASKFAEHFKIKYIPSKSVQTILDKSKFYKLFQKLGVGIPETDYIYEPGDLLKVLWPGKNYYLKSDYSKNPDYVYELNCLSPLNSINWTKDRYFRKCYVLQEKVFGNHYRVDCYEGEFLYFRKITELMSKPVRGVSNDKLKEKIEKALTLVIKNLKLGKYLVKFDIIMNNNSYFVLDMLVGASLTFMLIITLKNTFTKNLAILTKI